MSHLNPGLLSAYNSLTDKHLAGYFSNARIRRHLQGAGLITRSGRIVPDKEYRHKLIQRAQKRHVHECLAQAIFHKVLEMERTHRTEIKRKLDEFARRERVHKIKVERSRRYEDDLIRILSPHPPRGARDVRKQHSGPEGEHSESSESLGSSRPNTAPGKMQRPVRLKPIHSNGTTASLRRSSPYRPLVSSNENEQPFNCTMDKESRRRLIAMQTSHGISPYCLPVINNFVTPIPPATKRKESGIKVPPGGTLRGRRLRPTTATGGADVTEDPPLLRSSVHQSRVCANMVYFGKTVHLSHDLTDMRDEVKVFQQHCGGENLCVYKGGLREGETFQFISRRHRGFPFSLTFFLNGLQVERLSSCCEFRHRKGSRLGGRHGHFGFFSVEGASPCYKCIIAMGLDKKPTPPPKSVKEEGGREQSVPSPKDAPEMEAERTGAEAASHSDGETSQPQDTGTEIKQEKATEKKVRDEYEEDFEADEEGPEDEVKENKSPSPSSETETRVKERDTSDTEGEEKDGSSCSSSDRDTTDDEDTKDSREEEEKAEQPEEMDHPPDEKEESYPEEASVPEAQAVVAKDADLQDSARNSTEISISDTGVEQKEAGTEEMAAEGQQEQEEERAKSVQEKLAEAILKESQCSSEPEMSDTSTEEEEEATGKGHGQTNKDVVAEQQQTLVEDTTCEEIEPEAVQCQEETPESKEREDETAKELHGNSDDTKDEILQEDDENPASKAEETTGKDESEDTGAVVPLVSEESMTEESQIEKCQEDARVEEEEEEEEDDTQPDETGQGAKSSEAGESSVPEPNKNSDERTASENEEAEAMTPTESKAEPSEEREALSCEEAPVSDAEEKQQEDTRAASQTGATAEDSSSSTEGSGDTRVGTTAVISEEHKRDEGRVEHTKEEESEEASWDGNRQEGLGEEQRGEPVGINGEADGEERTGPEVKTEAERSEGKEENDGIGEHAESRGEREEDGVEDIKIDTNETQSKEGAAGKTEDGEDGEKEEESEKREVNEGSGRAEDITDEKESEAKGAVTDKTDEGEEMKEMEADADEEKVDDDDDDAETEEKDESENTAEQSESGKNKEDEESAEEKTSTTCKTEEGREVVEVHEEPEKNTDDAKISSEDPVELAAVEDVGDGDAADVPGTTEAMSDNAESEDAKKETEGASANGTKEEINAENGEISNGATIEGRDDDDDEDDEAEASNEGKQGANTAGQDENKRKTDETEEESAELKEVGGGDDAEGHGDDDDKVDQAPEAKGGDDEEEVDGKREESAPDISGENGGEATREENGNGADLDHEKRDSESLQNTEGDISEEMIASSVVLGTSGRRRPFDEKAAAAADGGNGVDAEEAGKASGVGASVALQPRAQNSEAETAGQSQEPPEAPAGGDNTDLVTNWITTHQMSNFFETFVEPLEDLREDTSPTQASTSGREEAKLTDLPRPESPLKTARTSGSVADEQTQKDEREAQENNGAEAVETELESKRSEDEAPDNNSTKDNLLDNEEPEGRGVIPNTETENDDEDSTHVQRAGSKGAREEDEVQDRPTESDISKTEVESIAGTQVSVSSGKPEQDAEKQSVETGTGNGPDLDENQTETEGTTNLPPASETEEHPDARRGAEETGEKTQTDKQSGEVTEITDFKTSGSQDGSQEESHRGGVVSAELIQDIKRTLSKDRPGSFSVDETLFGRSSHPLLTAARTESLH